jgi:uncharacterized protein (TIRG00374 family)
VIGWVVSLVYAVTITQTLDAWGATPSTRFDSSAFLPHVFWRPFEIMLRFAVGAWPDSYPWARHLVVMLAQAGSVLKSFLLREAYGTANARSAPIVVAERLTDLLALLILSTIGVAGSGYGWPTIVISTGLVLSIVAVFAWPAAGKLAIGLCARLPVLSKLAPRLEEARHAMRQLVGLRVLSVTLGLSLIAWAGECVGAWLILNGVPGMSPTFEQATFVYAFSTVAGALSMLPGGLIAAEGSMIVLLGITASIQASPEIATAGTLMMRFATLWFGVPLGIMALVLFRRRIGRDAA